MNLERTGNLVFHGSGRDLEILTPQQSIDFKQGPDRSPAIFASPAADMAIFHAIFNGRNFPDKKYVFQSGAISHDNGSFDLKFTIPKEALGELPDSASGFVYVFDRRSFLQIPGRGAEYESTTSVKPIKKIKVFKKDLTSNIELI